MEGMDKRENHHDEPEPKRDHPKFGLSKAGLAIIAVLVVALVALHMGYSPDPSTIGRDAGGFAGSSNYGGGGGYGGGSSSYDYDYDYGSSSYYDYDWGSSNSDYDWDSDYGYVDLGIIDIVIIVIIFAAILAPGFLPSRPSHANTRKQQPAGATPTSQSKLKPVSKLQERDPQFSEAVVNEMIANVYVKMQQAWTAGDFEPMRPYFSNTLFSQFANQLSGLTKKGWVNYVDNIAVLETSVRGWYETDGFEYLVMKVRTRITDYTLDKAGKVVSGHTDAESFMEYEYTLERPAGTKTTAQTAQTEAGECPNCGAPINLAQSARCEYCGTIVESKRFTWVISAIKGISQQISK